MKIESLICTGATFVPDWLKGLKKWSVIAGEQTLPGWLVYGGVDGYRRESIEVLPWRSLAQAARTRR